MEVQAARSDIQQGYDVVRVVGDERVAVPIAAHVCEDVLDRGEISAAELKHMIFRTEVDNRVLPEAGIEHEAS